MNKQESRVFVVKTKKERIYGFLEKKPNANIHELRFEFPGINKKTISDYKWMFKREQNMFKPEYVECIKILLNIMNTKMNPITLMSKKEKEAILKLSELVSRSG